MKSFAKKVLRWMGRWAWKGLKALGILLGVLGLFLFEKLKILAQLARKKWSTYARRTQQALIVAAAVHLIILIVAGLIVAIPGKRITPEIVTTIVETPSIPDVQQQRLSAIKQVKQVQPSASSAITKMMLAETKAAVNLPPGQINVPTDSLTRGIGNLGLGNGFGSGMGTGAGGGSAFPVEIRGRCIPGERARLLRKNGGSPQVEAAVSRSLDWLKDEQSRTGTWGKKYKGSMTGFAVLCYLGRCETPRSAKYGKTVTKGIQAILEMGKKNDGYFTMLSEPTFPYEHGIATYALGETLAMTKGEEIPGVREGFIRGVEKIIEGQTPDGGWIYRYANNGAGDLSVTGWQVQALKAAQRLNLGIAGLEECMARAAEFVSTRQGPKGGFGYRNIGDKKSLAGVGILSLQFLGRPSRSQAAKAFSYWFEEVPVFEYDDSDCDLYAAYYINQSLFNYGGSDWSKWNSQMQPQLLRAQNPNGSYPEEGSRLSGSQGDADAEIYRTVLSTLMLEVYYRYLPVNG